MSWVYASDIKKASDYLLEILFSVIEVRYSEIYDGTDETVEQLLSGMGFPEDDYTPESPELLRDLAAAELERQGFVKLTELDDLLADGERNYLIELTEEGCDKFSNGEEPDFRDLEM
jgi:hypothetical protein